MKTSGADIKSLLSEGEEKLIDAKVHYFVFFSPIFYGLVALILGIFFHPLIGGIIMFMNLYPIYMSTVYFITTHLILTNKKVMGRTGYLTRDWTQLNLNKVETAKLEEPIIGRIVGFSTVIVRGTGSGNITFPYIQNGEIFINKLETMLANLEEKKA
jgi:uncharacterized membrane protein YdbT with pleckstrin-like domain